ncbi:MAG: Rho termination factor N-terminal domain-containing protein [Thermoplasmata archaeon]
MKNIKKRLEEKSNEDLIKMAKLKGVKNYNDMNREELIKKLVDRYEKTYSTTC